jgi:hypothetical protein
MVPDWAPALTYVADARTRAQFPVYYAGHRLAKGSYASDGPRTYAIRDRGGSLHRAYRIVVDAGDLGQYYGIQGTSWTAPPLLDSPSETRRIGGRRYDLFFDGDRLRLIAFRTKRAVYWVSNTLSQTLTNRQMLDLAGSLRRARG